MKGMKTMKIMKIDFSKTLFMFFTSFMFFMFCALVAQQKPPVFRTKIDLMQLDVTVLDKSGKPVRGLTKDDFTLAEDNKPQTIEGFSAVDVPERVIAGPVWDGKVANDVVSNEIDNVRIFVLVIDDGFGMGGRIYDELVRKLHWPDPAAIEQMKKSARLFVNSLGPKDLAAVAFTGTTAKFSQNLTSDKAKLIAAIDKYPDLDSTLFLDPGTPPKGMKPMASHCLAHKEILRMIHAVVDQLASLPDRRKSIVYFGGQMPWAAPGGCGTGYMWNDVFAAAQQGSVTINPIQTAGLGLGDIDPYLSVAGETGGYAVVNTNDFAPGVKRIFSESSSYYLLAYQPTKDLADGTFRRISVKVKGRDDVEIVTRRNYWAPRPKIADDPDAPPPSAAVKSMAGLLPDSKLPLRVTAAAFAAPDGTAVITLALGVRQPAFASRTSETVDLMIRSFTATGDPKANDDQTIPITVPAARADVDISRYEVLARIGVAKPGSYHLRLTARSDASDTRGSVYVDVEVPDFKKDKLSLSGIIVNNVAATTPTAPLRLLRDVSMLTPTTERTFSNADLVTTLARVYQGGNDRIVPVTMKVTVTDAAGKAAFNQSDTVAADRFTPERSADYQFRLPLDKLAAGDHLLSFEAAIGKNTARRDIRFQKK